MLYKVKAKQKKTNSVPNPPQQLQVEKKTEVVKRGLSEEDALPHPHPHP